MVFLYIIHPDALLFGGYAFLSAFLPFLIVFCLFLRLYRKRGRHISPFSRFFLLLFAVYVTGVYYITGAGTLYEGLRYLPVFRPAYNLIPFSQHIDLTGYILNVALFLPLGLLVPFLWDRADRFLSVLGTGAGFSLFIETTQLLNARATDVDDLILNTAGALLGYAVFKVLDCAAGSRFRPGNVPLPLLAVCILAPYLGRFFLYDEMGLARLLYGF